MSEEFDPTYDESQEFEDSEFEENAEYEEIEEEINSDEVDRVLESLTSIMEKVESETIHEVLDETYNQIFGLVYEEAVEVDGEIASGDEINIVDEDDELDDEDDELDDDLEDAA